MSDLKSSLKEAKQLLSTGKSQEAVDLLQDFLDRDIEDYMLFCFAALANANLEEYEEAQELYEKAIALDASKPVAWQGLFKLYEAEELESSHRGVEVCERIIKTGDEDKKKAATAARRRILLKLGQFEELLNDLGDDTGLMAAVVDRLEPKKVLSTTERQLLTTAFTLLSSHFAEFPEHHLKYCKYSFKSSGDRRGVIRDYCSIHGASDEWIIDRLVQIVAEDYFCNPEGQLHEFWTFMKDAVPGDNSKVNFEILKYLKNGNLTSALELLDQLSISQTNSYPSNLLASRLVAECEDWEKVIQILDAVNKEDSNEEVETVKMWLLARANLEIIGKDAKSPVFTACRSSQTSAPPEFVYERMLLEPSPTDAPWLQSLSERDQTRAGLLTLLLTGQPEKAVELGAQLVQEGTWKDHLWAAEAYQAAGKDCVNLLVKAAKLNPRSSRIFYLLGRQLSKKNPTKARGCLERAVKVRPTNEDYVKSLDEVLAKANETPENRLPYLKALAKRTSPIWLRETIARLSMATNDLDTAIAEFQRVVRVQSNDLEAWANLAEAYAKKGHLNASLNAYEQILTISPESDFAVPLVGVLIRLRKYEEALEKISTWREVGTKHETAVLSMDILEAQAHISLATVTYCEEKLEHLRRAVAILTPVVSQRPRYSLLYKLVGDVLLQIAHCREDLLPTFKLDSLWDLKTCDEVVKQAATFYSVAFDLSKKSILAWKDLITALLILAARTKETKFAQAASELLKQAISTTNSADTKSALWVLLGEARRLLGQSAAIQQHCFIRALQLNKGNDEAWLRLAVLYLQNGKNDQAHQAFETTLKYNPQSAEAWCGWGAKADLSGHVKEGVELYRQAMAIKSLPLAVERFTAFECENMKATKTNFDTSAMLREFPEIFDIFYSFHSDSRLFTHLGVLAELFGHYAESVQCHQRSGTSNDSSDYQRALIRAGVNVERLDSSLTAFAAISGKPTDALFEEMKKNSIYGSVFAFLQEDDEEASGLRQIFTQFRKKISIPLVISAIIHFEIPISDASVRVLHDVLPRHELIDVFPTVLPEGLDRELQYLEQDGEAPFRYRHHVAKELFEELKKRREELPPKEPTEAPVSDE